MHVKAIIKLPNNHRYEEVVYIDDYPKLSDDDISSYIEEVMRPKIEITWRKFNTKMEGKKKSG